MRRVCRLDSLGDEYLYELTNPFVSGVPEKVLSLSVDLNDAAAGKAAVNLPEIVFRPAAAAC
jgi:hypothetical protein